jgi:hypothetical protein
VDIGKLYVCTDASQGASYSWDLGYDSQKTSRLVWFCALPFIANSAQISHSESVESHGVKTRVQCTGCGRETWNVLERLPASILCNYSSTPHGHNHSGSAPNSHLAQVCVLSFFFFCYLSSSVQLHSCVSIYSSRIPLSTDIGLCLSVSHFYSRAPLPILGRIFAILMTVLVGLSDHLLPLVSTRTSTLQVGIRPFLRTSA